MVRGKGFNKGSIGNPGKITGELRGISESKEEKNNWKRVKEMLKIPQKVRNHTFIHKVYHALAFCHVLLCVCMQCNKQSAHSHGAYSLFGLFLT